MLELIVSHKKQSSDNTEQATKRTETIQVIPKNKALKLNVLCY